jgi:HEAT repeat protein
MKSSPVWPSVSCLIFFALLACTVGAQGERTSLKQIQRMIAAVKAASTPNLRADAASRLAAGMREMEPSYIDDKTFGDLVSLMDSPEDAVRGAAAGALGFLGARSKPAIPKLLEILAKVDCVHGAVTSADAIRTALKRIGVTPPPRPDCTRIGG